jgi:hypothetical protein
MEVKDNKLGTLYSSLLISIFFFFLELFFQSIKYKSVFVVLVEIFNEHVFLSIKKEFAFGFLDNIKF